MDSFQVKALQLMLPLTTNDLGETVSIWGFEVREQ